MPRKARKKSKSGIYHIMLRGINKQPIFHEEEDNIRFIEILGRCKKKSNMKIHGMCLMNNHIHMLVKEGEEDISNTIKRIGISYALFYNYKYNSVGHVFQDRFRSEPVDSDDYIMTVIRYIHQNPVKAGIVRNPIEWKWSSYHGYCGRPFYPIDLIDNELILGMLSTDKEKAIQLFIHHNEQINDDECLDESPTTRLTDAEAKTKIIKLVGRHSISEIKRLPKKQRDEILRRIKEIDRLSLRQAARVTGISHVIIYKA